MTLGRKAHCRDLGTQPSSVKQDSHLRRKSGGLLLSTQSHTRPQFVVFFLKYGNAWLLLLVHFLRCVWNLKLGARKVVDLQLAAVRLINSEMHKSVSRGDSLYPSYTVHFSYLPAFFAFLLLRPEKQGPLEDCCLSVQKMDRRMPSIPRAG